jgi:hypothetical protein
MSVGSKKCHTGHEIILAFLRNPRGRSPLVEPPPVRTVSPQAKPYNGYVFAPSPQRGNPPCSFQLGEGPAFQVQSANVRLLVDRHFLGGLNLIQMLLPHNELPVMLGGVGGITPLDIPPIPPLYSQRGVMLATRKPLLQTPNRRGSSPSKFAAGNARMMNSAPLRSANFTGSTTAAAMLLLCCCCVAGVGAAGVAGAAAVAAAAAAAGAGVSAALQWTESSAEIPMADRRWSSLPLSVPFPRRPNPTTVTSSLRPRNEETPAVLSLSLSLSLPVRFPVAHRRWSGQVAVAPTPQTVTSLSLALSPRAIPRGPPPLGGPVRRGSDPANKALAGGRVFRVRCRRDPPWPTAGLASALLPLY